MYCTLYMICSGFLHQHHPGGALLWGSSDRRWWRLHDGRLRPSLRPQHWAQHSAALHLLPSFHEHRGYASMQHQMRKKVVEEYELPVYLFCLPLQSRWAEFCKEPPSPRTSRSDLTSPVLCLDRMEVWCPTHLTSPSTWEPCRRLSSTRWGTNSPATCEWVFLSVVIHVEWQKDVVVFFFCEQLRSLGNKLKEGDVILSNHPSAGGSHLPDLTVITPVSPPSFSTLFLPSNSSSILSSLPFFFLVQVFRKGVSGPVFFVASRGHHADIGGITPGSMPPHSTSLQQEGAVFTSFKLVTGGVFQEEGKWGGDESGPECDTLLKGESIENQEMTLNLR